MYTVDLTEDGIAEICLAEDDAFCVTYEICPSEPEFDFSDVFPCPTEDNPGDAYDTLLDWFGAELGLSGN